MNRLSTSLAILTFAALTGCKGAPEQGPTGPVQAGVRKDSERVISHPDAPSGRVREMTAKLGTGADIPLHSLPGSNRSTAAGEFSYFFPQDYSHPESPRVAGPDSIVLRVPDEQGTSCSYVFNNFSGLPMEVDPESGMVRIGGKVAMRFRVDEAGRLVSGPLQKGSGVTVVYGLGMGVYTFRKVQTSTKFQLRN